MGSQFCRFLNISRLGFVFLCRELQNIEWIPSIAQVFPSIAQVFGTQPATTYTIIDGSEVLLKHHWTFTSSLRLGVSTSTTTQWTKWGYIFLYPQFMTSEVKLTRTLWFSWCCSRKKWHIFNGWLGLHNQRSSQRHRCWTSSVRRQQPFWLTSCWFWSRSKMAQVMMWSPTLSRALKYYITCHRIWACACLRKLEVHSQQNPHKLLLWPPEVLAVTIFWFWLHVFERAFHELLRICPSHLFS